MTESHDTRAQPDGPAWDISSSRTALSLSPASEACAFDLTCRFKAIGLHSDTQVVQMPRGLSTFLSLIGERGLVCIVEITLVDGMAIGRGPYVGLELRLLDACGDVAANVPVGDLEMSTFHETSSAETHISERLDRAATAVYVAALAQFDLLQPLTRQA